MISSMPTSYLMIMTCKPHTLQVFSSFHSLGSPVLIFLCLLLHHSHKMIKNSHIRAKRNMGKWNLNGRDICLKTESLEKWNEWAEDNVTSRIQYPDILVGVHKLKSLVKLSFLFWYLQLKLDLFNVAFEYQNKSRCLPSHYYWWLLLDLL